MKSEPGGIFITGGAGKTGRALLRLLSRDGALAAGAVSCLMRPGGDRTIFDGFPVRIVAGDASDPSSLARAYGGEGTVIHISSIFHSETVLGACRKAGRLIAVSSTGRFSRLRSYAAEIARQEALIERSGLGYTILRPTMIYGTPDDGNISRLVSLVSKRRIVPVPVMVGSIFQPVHVEDLAGALLAALRTPASTGRSYNLAGGSSHTLPEIVGIIASLLGRRTFRLPVPYPAALAAARLLGIIMRDPPVGVDQIRRLVEDKSCDCSEAARDLDFAPMTFRDGALRLVRAMGLEPASNNGAIPS